jgi:hypothetical protein
MNDAQIEAERVMAALERRETNHVPLREYAGYPLDLGECEHEIR